MYILHCFRSDVLMVRQLLPATWKHMSETCRGIYAYKRTKSMEAEAVIKVCKFYS